MTDTDTDRELAAPEHLMHRRQQQQPQQPQANNQQSRLMLKEINLDMHLSPQMIVLYVDTDSENRIKHCISTFSALAYKYSKLIVKVEELKIKKHQTILFVYCVLHYSKLQHHTVFEAVALDARIQL